MKHKFFTNKSWYFIFLISAYLLQDSTLLAQDGKIVIDNIIQTEHQNLPPNPVVPTVHDNQLVLETDDSCTVINLIDSYIRPQLRLQLWQDIDTTKKYIYKAMAIAQKINYVGGINTLRRCLGSAYTAKGPQDSAQFYLRYSIKQMEDIRDTSRISFFLMQYARSCWLSSKFDSAIYHTERAAQYALAIRDSTDYLYCASLLPKYFFEAGDYVKCAKSSLQNLELAIQFKDTFNIVFNARYLAKVYSSMGLYGPEMEAALIAIQYGGNSNDVNTNFHSHLAIADAYYHQHQYDSAITYSWKNISLFYGGGQNLSHLTLGAVYRDLGLMDSALYHIQNFIDATIKFKLHVWPEPFFLLGSCEMKKGNFQKAMACFLKAEAELKPQNKLIFRDIYKSLYVCFDTLQDPEKALQYLKQYMALDDSMQLSLKSFAIAMLESEKESKHMQDQIHWLTTNNQLQQLLTVKERQQKNMLYASFPILAFIVIIGFVRYRKQKALKSKQVLLNERLRISRDLHDEVGATLGGIAMYSHLAKSQMGNSPPSSLTKSLDTIQQSSAEMVSKLSDIVWLLNPAHDSLKQLMEKLEDHAKRMASIKHAQVMFSLPKDLKDISLPVESRRNIYLIFKEAIHNSMKYSQATKMEMKAHSFDHSMKLEWQDNGVGFESDHVQQGNGLANMQKRADDIGAKLSLDTGSLKGTKITLLCKVPH